MEWAAILDPAPSEGVLGLMVDANIQTGSSPAAAFRGGTSRQPRRRFLW